MDTNADPSLQMLACSYIDRQLNRLMKHLHGARIAKDTEDIHQSRVACRRMCAAMDLFPDCFNAKSLAAWQRDMKKMLKAFGAARDLDVQILFLKGKLKSLSPEQKKFRPGLRRLLLRWRQQRQAVQPQVIKTVKNVQKKQVLRHIHHEVDGIVLEIRHSRLKKDDQAVRRRAYERISEKSGELVRRFSAINEPENIDGHHAIRIAAKELRYVMEICDEAIDGLLKSTIKKIKQMQTLFGDMHDCDVWSECIDGFVKDEGQRSGDFYGTARPFARVLVGLEYFKEDRAALRSRLYEKAKKMIDDFNKHDYLGKLTESLKPLTPTQQGTPCEPQSDEQS